MLPHCYIVIWSWSVCFATYLHLQLPSALQSYVHHLQSLPTSPENQWPSWQGSLKTAATYQDNSFSSLGADWNCCLPTGTEFLWQAAEMSSILSSHQKHSLLCMGNSWRSFLPCTDGSCPLANSFFSQLPLVPQRQEGAEIQAGVKRQCNKIRNAEYLKWVGEALCRPHTSVCLFAQRLKILLAFQQGGFSDAEQRGNTIRKLVSCKGHFLIGLTMF